MPALQYRESVHRGSAPAPDPRLEQLLRCALLLGLALVLTLPAARGSSQWLGAAPLWLLGMPLASWWALHRCPLPRWPRAAAGGRRRPGTPQARRRGSAAGRRRNGLARAA